jgi:hypothetical protein
VLLLNDAPILRPVLGLLNSVSSSNAVNSNYYPRHVRVFAGDPLFLGCFGPVFRSNMYSMKNWPVFKPIDFYQIFDLVQQFLVILLNNYHANIVQRSQVPFCPLTQKALLLLVAGICRVNFADSQILSQGINPYATTSTANDWTPFLMTSNCYPSEIFNAVIMPLAFWENLRSLRMRAVYGARKPKKVKGKISYVEDFNNPQLIVPSLGYFTGDSIPVLQYVSMTTGSPVLTPILAPVDPSEVLPALHDGYIGSNTYVDMGTGDYLNSIVNNWNSFLTELSNCVESPTVLGQELGIMAFSQVGCTDYIVQIPGQDGVSNDDIKGITPFGKLCIKEQRRKDRLLREESLRKRKLPVEVMRVDAQASTNGIAATTASFQFNSVVWPHISFWIRPSIRIGIELSEEQSKWSVTNGQIALNEPFRINGTQVAEDGTGIPTISQEVRNLEFARLMVTNIGASGPNGYTNMLLEAAKEGRGSGISDIIKAFAAPAIDLVSSLL